MLETKDLVKVYKPKKGVPVTALSNVTLKFPEKGMVFLLGKSGSGKSTLLNVLGGLDNYNSGEIKIKGVSSKDFKQKHFDSYRNTYVGFIFQEYNVLDDFTVGANIALAIELQNRKAEDSEVNAILKEVDLEGYGGRKPNELSGGQKQRVAIARALVKKPQIIMADEPTGALDSNTGKQVLDTLKKLSREKLVIVVSHDREFAEQYADRIIELSDGKVISDVELIEGGEAPEIKQEIGFSGNTVEIPCGYHITEQDRIAINDYIDRVKEGKVSLNISSSNTVGKHFAKTDESKIKAQDGSAFKLIKSKLPLKNAFKIGASSLKYKKIRLVFTILLSCVSFGLFGLADTFGAYDHIEACTNSIVDSELNYVATAKAKLIKDGNYSYYREGDYHLSQTDLQKLTKNTGVDLEGVYIPVNGNLDYSGYIDSSVSLTETDFSVFRTSFAGFTEITDSKIKSLGYTLLAGALPDGNKNEIAVSEYVFEIFKRAKYADGTNVTKDGKIIYENITAYKDIVGKKINLNGTEFTITAVIDTGYDLERYLPLTEEQEHTTDAQKLINYVLSEENYYATQYSYTGLAMVGDGYVDTMIKNRPKVSAVTEGWINFYSAKDSYGIETNYMARLGDLENEKIVWLNGEKKSLGEKEIIVTADSIYVYDEGKMQEYLKEDGTVDYAELLKGDTTLNGWKYNFSEDEEIKGYEIVGIIETNNAESTLGPVIVCSDSLFSEFAEDPENCYNFAVGTMPKEKNDIENLVSFCYGENEIRYPIQSSVTYELDMVNDTLKEFSKIFLYIGIGFAVFAALMLANFIGTSISYKKQEIGILRAIGSRSNDVFRIFFAESFVIAMINFVLSAAGVFTVTAVINYILRNELGILITVLNFGVRQIVLLLAVSIVVAFIASFLPVKKIASKRPIDAIRNR